MIKYLLSTGDTTTKIEEYILDLFKMNLVIRPNDIPHYNSVGFDFILVGVPKDRLQEEVRGRLEDLVKDIQSHFDKNTIKISLDTVSVINEETVSVTVKINNYVSGEIRIEL